MRARRTRRARQSPAAHVTDSTVDNIPADKLFEVMFPLVEDLANGRLGNNAVNEAPLPAAAVNGASPTRHRRTRAEMTDLRDALVDIVKDGTPMTVRQVYYQAVTRGLIDKTEQAYKAICRLLVLMRRQGHIAYDDIADNTRGVRKVRSYGSLEDAVRETAHLYRRQVWGDLDCRVEIWLEKEALMGVLIDVTVEWDVPLMVTRGYPSLSFLHLSGEVIRESELPTYIYYFGDHDPSGLDIARHVQRGVTEFAGDVPVFFERVAVTRDQIEELGLPTRPTKRTDSRAKGWRGGSVEVDAIHPTKLRAIATTCIEQHIPEGHMDVLWAAERSEKQLLRAFGRTLRDESEEEAEDE